LTPDWSTDLVLVSSHFRFRLLRHMGHCSVRWPDLDLCLLFDLVLSGPNKQSVTYILDNRTDGPGVQ